MPNVSRRRARVAVNNPEMPRQGSFPFAIEPIVEPKPSGPSVPKGRVWPGRPTVYTAAEMQACIPGPDDIERWFPIRDWPDYEISDWGRVQSYKKRGGRTPGKSLSPHLVGGYRKKKGGHISVVLTRDCCREQRQFFVHILMLETFVGPRPPGMDACHSDGNPANNRLSNLRWDTKSNNSLDRLRHGNGPNKLTEDDIRSIWGRLLAKESDSAIAKSYDVMSSLVTAIKLGNIWTHVTSSLPGFPIVTENRAASNENRPPIYVSPEYTDSVIEIWKPVPDYPAYRVSNFGRLGSRWMRPGFGRKPVIGNTWKLMNPCQSTFGHRVLLLYSEGKKRKYAALHSLILTTFACPRPTGMIACHNDGDPSNNHTANLRWDTCKANVIDRYRHASVANAAIS